MKKYHEGKIRVDFSLRREVLFVVIGAVVGAVLMVFPRMVFEAGMGLPYYITWIAFGHVVGVYSSFSVLAGITIHMITAICIGVVIGIFLYKSGILNISKLSNGLIYGLFAGMVVFILFFIPVSQFVLAPEIARTLTEMIPSMTEIEAAKQLVMSLPLIIGGAIVTHLVFGVTVGLISSILSIKFGARYRCPECDISLARIDSHQKHREMVHGAQPITLERILILGGGFAGVQVLRALQKEFQDDVSVDITLVSRDNFFLFTPMLPEVSSGMIETRNILTPVRTFCNRARFYEAEVESIDLKNRQVVITHFIGRQIHPVDSRYHELKYDYLVLSLGSETNFFGMSDVADYAFTIKNIGDAVSIRNHVINMLEQADVEHQDFDLKKSLMTFVVVGGGFSGVETVGELNDFVRESIKYFYHNIEMSDIRIVLVNSSRRILPEVTEDLSEFALQRISKNGVEVLLNTRLTGVDANSVRLSDGMKISTYTVIWAGGNRPNPLLSCLQCEHDKNGRILTDNYLEVKGYNDHVFALGDCACIIDPNTSKACPPTAQHALRQAKVVANNISALIKHKGKKSKKINKKRFDYKTKGMMALIGKKNGVGVLFGYKIHGFLAWAIWRFYYLSTLPTMQKKVRVMVDWFIDLLFKRDVTRLKTHTMSNGFNLPTEKK
ncbi:MAG TPA: NAD(P)/FAD-dependent oxidoreductase [Nitrososphaeraceae archaeon]|nr:NAD(P)/FAD-dependent oxidoreductase [Nitrososphaeraceae archaeon]